MKVTIYKREGSRKWWLRYVDREGIIRRTSSGSTDKAVARQMADKIEAELAQWTPPTGDGGEGGQSPGGADVDPLARQIAELEHLMLTVVSYQAQAQEISSKRIAELLRRLLGRVRDLEEMATKELLENGDTL